MCENNGCSFHKAWIGKCDKPIHKGGLCKEHFDLTCASCGDPATRSCDQTGVQFVCGASLCGNCTHGVIDPKNPGMFMLGGGHITKKEYNDATYSKHAEEIEDKAADQAYKADLGVGEWEAFLTEGDVKILVLLAKEGYGTWGKEGRWPGKE
jgi:hypothetical protein